ncbi:hypothetical protein BOTBODRAFT_38237 [Botryobasidium botryosum FD-172 SS1]|uniref:Uncharacterized protein n=1 Tax=Botryobasidium botryosum (strain FD-172 SS1) TaxID=930990 RepID=A0A067M963_BOTB1|nr:hypothetical protein BOTBODRAFT_38237 [Botryobasidium botryosum FD-172 SS1]
MGVVLSCLYPIKSIYSKCFYPTYTNKQPEDHTASYNQPIEFPDLIGAHQDVCGIALRRTFGFRLGPSIGQRALGLHAQKCDTLHMHSQAILNVVSGVDIEGPDRLAINNHFMTLMGEISFSIRYWANLDCYGTLVHQFDIDIAVEEKLRRLDACFSELGVASSMGPQWGDSFASAREKDMGVLQKELELQQNPEKWRNAYDKALCNALKKLQLLLNQQKSNPEQNDSYRKILTVLGVAAETPYVVCASGHQADFSYSIPEPPTIETLGTLGDAAALSAAHKAMQELAIDLMAIKYHTKKIDILRSHCESICSEIKRCQHSDQLTAALKEFTGFRIVFQPFVRSWESLDSSESYLRQFTVTRDIEVILERLDTLLADNNIVCRLPPRSWDSAFTRAITEDANNLAGILKEQGVEIWNTVYSAVLDSVVEYLPTLMEHHDPGSSPEETTSKILKVLGISLQEAEAEEVTSGTREKLEHATAPFTQSAAEDARSANEVWENFETALASVEAFAKMVNAFGDIHPYAKAAWTALSAGYKIAAAQKDQDDALSELLESMSMALDLVCRLGQTPLQEDDKRILLHVAKKTSECALFIQEYTRTKSVAPHAAKEAFPKYSDESTIARFKKDFDVLPRNIDAAAMRKVLHQFDEILDVDGTFRDEITALGEHALSIDASFGLIHMLLKKIQIDSASPELQATFRNLSAYWLDLRKTYEELFWQSREVTGEAKGAADDFTTSLIPFLGDDASPQDEKIREIDSMMQKLRADSDKAQDLSQAFSDLRILRSFGSEWKAAIDKHDRSKINRYIQELESINEHPNLTLAQLEEKASTYAGHGGGYDEAIRPQEDTSAKVETSGSKLVTARADLQAIDALQAALTVGEADLVNIDEKLSAFASLWAVIRADTQGVKEKLDYLGSTKHKQLFEARMRTFAKLYKVLSAALYYCEVTLDEASKKFNELNDDYEEDDISQASPLASRQMGHSGVDVTSKNMAGVEI